MGLFTGDNGNGSKAQTADFDPRNSSLVSFKEEDNNQAKELIRQKRLQDWLAILDHENIAMSNDFIDGIATFRENQMKSEEDIMWMKAISRCSVDAGRAKLYAQLATEVLIPNSISPGSKSDGYVTPKRNK